jgi:hypothetical protein
VLGTRAWWIDFSSALEVDHLTEFLETLETLHLEELFEIVRFLLLPAIYRFDVTHQANQYGGDLYARLLSRCTGLREVHMTFHASAVCDDCAPHRPHSNNLRVAGSVNEVLDRFELRSILNCTRISRIELCGIDPVNDYRYRDIDSLQALAGAGR